MELALVWIRCRCTSQATRAPSWSISSKVRQLTTILLTTSIQQHFRMWGSLIYLTYQGEGITVSLRLARIRAKARMGQILAATLIHSRRSLVWHDQVSVF